ncbi:hypothetical protein M8N52_22150, partial [Enterobacter hormaechei]|nr:hypothetical protein [Enterobacter hormaechei]
NRLKHEEMKWLSQPRRISPLIRTFPSIQPLTSSALLLDEKESFLLFFISFLVSPAQPAIRNIMSIKIFTIIPPVKEG